MVKLTDYTTYVNLPIGTVKTVPDNSAKEGAVTYNTLTQNGTWIKSNAVYNQSDYPELYSQVGLLNASAFTPRHTTYAANTVGYSGGLYIAGSDTVEMTSTDGVTWDVQASYISGLSSIQSLPATLYSNGLFVIGGSGGNLYTSTNAATWIPRTSGSTADIQALTYGNGTYVYVGTNGNVGTSTDGITWTPRTTGISSGLYGVAYGNGVYALSGTGGTLYSSTDAITWTSRTLAGDTNTYWNMLYNNGLFLAAGGSGRIVTSTDAITWTPRTSGTTTLLYSSTYGNGLYLLASQGGVLLTSTDANRYKPLP